MRRVRHCTRRLPGDLPCPRQGVTTRGGRWLCRPCVRTHDREARVREQEERGAPQTDRERRLADTLARVVGAAETNRYGLAYVGQIAREALSR